MLGTGVSVLANPIDSLETREDVVAFLDKLEISCVLATDSLSAPCTEMPASPAWVRADVNRDGLLDLVVNGRQDKRFTSVVLLGANSMDDIQQVTFATHPGKPCVLLDVVGTQPQELLLHELKRVPSDDPTKLFTYETHYKKDTLRYFHDTFLPVNDRPPVAIECIELKTSGCFGTCPVYRITFSDDGKVIFNASYHNKGLYGKYKSRLSAEDWEVLASLVNQYDLSQPYSKYEVPWTDDETMQTIITTASGQQVKVHDYGGKGDLVLERFYAWVTKIIASHDWKRIKKKPEYR